MYDIRDILRKAMTVSEKKRAHYLGILDNTPDIRMRAILQIMLRDIDKDQEHYKQLIETFNSDEHLQSIDFGLYDTISSLVNQYVRTFLVKPKIHDRESLIQYALETEKSVFALLVDIQGRMAQYEGMQDSVTYDTLTKQIRHKDKAIKNLEMFYKQHKS